MTIVRGIFTIVIIYIFFESVPILVNMTEFVEFCYKQMYKG